MTRTVDENRDIPGVTFLENGPVDVDQLNRLYTVIGWDRANRRTAEDTVRMLEVSRFYVSAHCSDLGLVGFARVCGDPYVAQVLDVITHPDWRRRGIATECMHHVVSHLRRSRYVTVTLTADTGLNDFYQRFDFKIFKDVARVWAPPR
jgi:ribosomal protein S18 acetylase RimI-like enzyme